MDGKLFQQSSFSQAFVERVAGGCRGTSPPQTKEQGALYSCWALREWPPDFSFPLPCPGLHGDSLSTSFGDSMTAVGRGTRGMTHSLVPGEAGKVWLSGSQAVWGRQSCCLRRGILWLTFPIHSLGLRIFIIFYDLHTHKFSLWFS